MTTSRRSIGDPASLSGTLIDSREPALTASARAREPSLESHVSEDEVVFYGQALQNEAAKNAAAWLGQASQHEATSGAAAWLGPQPESREDYLDPSVSHKEIFAGLARKESGTLALTIDSFGPADTIPLGTDLCPNNYNNLWAAALINDPVGQKLLTHNIGWRVLDAENLGFTYGENVLRQRRFDITGVKKAVAYFLQKGVGVIVVGKRKAMREEFLPEITSLRCEVVIADDSDDVFVMKKAFEYKCPIVSRDNYRSQKEDLRIDPELRRWWRDVGEQLRVKFAFDQSGSFTVDYDHHMPTLRPRSGPVRHTSRLRRSA